MDWPLTREKIAKVILNNWLIYSDKLL